MSVENVEAGWEMPTSPADIAKINAAIEEVVSSMVRKAAEQDLVKEIKKALKEEFGMPPKTITRLAKTAYQRNLDEQRANDEAFYEIYLKLRGKKEGLIDDEDEDGDE